MAREYFDLLIVVPLEVELAAVQAVFPHIEERSTSCTFRYVADAGVAPIKILVALQEGMGRSQAYRATAECIAEYDIGVVVCLGIAGAVSTDIEIGDVCYTGYVIDVTDNAKAEDTSTTISLSFSPTVYDTPHLITQAFNFLRLAPDLRAFHTEWMNDCKDNAKTVLKAPLVGRSGDSIANRSPVSLNGTVGCGLVNRSEAYKKKLLELDRKMLVIETESGGVFGAARGRAPAITIRGVSDYADAGKGELEASTRGAAREVAAFNAARFLRSQLANSRFVRILNERREQVVPTLPLFADAALPANDLSEILREVESDITARLRELSPEFRLKPAGYRLPTPRVRRIDRSAIVETSGPSAAEIEIKEAIRESRIVFLNMARTYPDQSLAYVIAHDLLDYVIGERAAVPIVIDGRELRPPNRGLDAVSGGLLGRVVSNETADPIVIVEHARLDSRTRSDFLASQISLHPQIRFVFVTREDDNVISESDLVQTLSATVYRLCDVSFVALSHFVERNFEMSVAESSVVALRLHETFRRFSLSAHPSYFAGIPRETLAALLTANRRAELIQLAVAGFLSFVVASDKSDVNLSRTTRTRFLQSLATAIKVESRDFSQEQLVSYTREFAKAHDFAIDSVAFIQSFIDKGILFFDGDRVSITLPFIESYLLATALTEQPALAKQYFDPTSAVFDFSTFDLYAEIRPEDQVVSALLQFMEARVRECNDTTDDHILLSKTEKSLAVSRPSRIQALQSRLRKAVAAVEQNRGDLEQKQRLLDLATHVREAAAKEVSKGTPRPTLHPMAQALWTGTVLLGSGAEHLNATTKRRLASYIVKLAGLVIDNWTRERLEIDFDKVKSELTSDDSIAGLVRDQSNKKEAAQIKSLLESLADVLQFAVLSEPFGVVLGNLCEQAHLPVLAKSVENSSYEGTVEEVLRAAWLADIDLRHAKRALRDAVRDLPPSPLLRTALAAHLHTRVFWSHWDKQGRLALLQAAQDAISPLQLTYDAESIRRKLNRPAAPGRPKRARRRRRT